MPSDLCFAPFSSQNAAIFLLMKVSSDLGKRQQTDHMYYLPTTNCTQLNFINKILLKLNFKIL